MATEEVAEKVQEVVADAAEFVEEQAVDFAEFARAMNKIKIQFGLLGAVIGAAGASLIAFKIAYLKAEKAANQRADDEIAEMREHYLAKGRALEGEVAKGDLATLVKDKGYKSSEPEMSTSPPMAVQPPKAVLASEDERADEPPEPSEEEMGEDEVEGPRGVKARGDEAVRNIFRDRPRVNFEWDMHTERKKRSADRPYVIHVDEKHEMEGYSDISLTYYTTDDVLCDERDEIMDPERRDETVGEANLDRFGHGSGDDDIVFVRNDNLEILYEIVKSPNSYAEEVHGLSPDSIEHGGYHRNVERMRRQERDGDQ